MIPVSSIIEIGKNHFLSLVNIQESASIKNDTPHTEEHPKATSSHLTRRYLERDKDLLSIPHLKKAEMVRRPDYDQAKAVVDFVEEIVQNFLSQVPGFTTLVLRLKEKLAEDTYNLLDMKIQLISWRNFWPAMPNEGKELLNVAIDLLDTEPDLEGAKQKLKEAIAKIEKAKNRKKELVNAKNAIDIIENAFYYKKSGMNQLQWRTTGIMKEGEKKLTHLLEKYKKQWANSTIQLADMKNELNSFRESFRKFYNNDRWWLYLFENRGSNPAAAYKRGEEALQKAFQCLA